MGATTTKQAIPVNTAREVIIDNSQTKSLFSFHWRTFGVSSLGFFAMAIIGIAVAAWCFRAQRRNHRRERRRLEQHRFMATAPPPVFPPMAQDYFMRHYSTPLHLHGYSTNRFEELQHGNSTLARSNANNNIAATNHPSEQGVLQPGGP